MKNLLLIALLGVLSIASAEIVSAKKARSMTESAIHKSYTQHKETCDAFFSAINKDIKETAASMSTQTRIYFYRDLQKAGSHDIYTFCPLRVIRHFALTGGYTFGYEAANCETCSHVISLSW